MLHDVASWWVARLATMTKKTNYSWPMKWLEVSLLWHYLSFFWQTIFCQKKGHICSRRNIACLPFPQRIRSLFEPLLKNSVSPLPLPLPLVLFDCFFISFFVTFNQKLEVAEPHSLQVLQNTTNITSSLARKRFQLSPIKIFTHM